MAGGAGWSPPRLGRGLVLLKLFQTGKEAVNSLLKKAVGGSRFGGVKFWAHRAQAERMLGKLKGREEGEARLWELIRCLEKYKPPSGEKLVRAAALWGAGQRQARTEKPCFLFLRINRDCLLFYLLDSLLGSRASPAITWGLRLCLPGGQKSRPPTVCAFPGGAQGPGG